MQELKAGKNPSIPDGTNEETVDGKKVAKFELISFFGAFITLWSRWIEITYWRLF